MCGGNGWVERRVPLGHPDFGELFPCRHTSQDKGAERIQLLQRYSGLHKEMLNRMTFERFVLKRYNLDSQGQSSLEAAYTAATDFAKTLEGWLLITGSHGSGKTTWPWPSWRSASERATHPSSASCQTFWTTCGPPSAPIARCAMTSYSIR